MDVRVGEQQLLHGALLIRNSLHRSAGHLEQWRLDAHVRHPIGNNCFFSREFGYFDNIASKYGLSYSAIIAAPTSANGCVIEYSTGYSDNQRKAQILYRFGVTLAVNADAQHLFPDLPVANATERAIAQTIRAGQG